MSSQPQARRLMPGEGQQSTSQEGGPWAGLMINDNVSDDESDSDREVGETSDSMRTIPPGVRAAKSSSSSDQQGSDRKGARTSWSQRAAAVGSRPPDTASQNPPSLKMLGLKSVKDGGLPIGNNGAYAQPPLSPALSMRQQVEQRQKAEQQQRSRTLLVEQQRQAARNRSPTDGQARPAEPAPSSSYFPQQQASRENDPGRHGSMINFNGTDGFGGVDNQSGPAAPANSGRSKEALPPLRSLEPPRNPYEDQPPTPRTALTHQLGLGNANSAIIEPMRNPYANQPANTPRSELAKELGLGGKGANSPPRGLVPAGGKAGVPSSHSSSQAGVVPRALVAGNTSAKMADSGVPVQRGAPPPLTMPQSSGQQRLGAGPPTPQSVALPSPVHMNGGPSNRSMPQPQSSARMPMPGNGAPGFSDARNGGGGPTRRPSLFRRSKAFLMGDSTQGVGGFVGRQNGMPPNGQPPQKRRSLFRRSVAMLTGRGGPPVQESRLADPDDDSNAPAPRVQGFVDEKPKDRTSTYLGASGMGDEWDFQGYGARFWKRFSVAQHKLQDGEFKDGDLIRQKTERRRRATKIASLLGGMIIILAVVAIIIWRENVKTSPTPGSITRNNGGLGDLESQDQGSQPTATGSANNANSNRGANGATPTTAPTTGAADATADDDTTTTTRRRRRKKKKNNDERRRGLASGEEGELDATQLIRRQVEQSGPQVRQTLPIEDNGVAKRDVQSLHSMVRHRKRGHDAMARVALRS